MRSQLFTSSRSRNLRTKGEVAFLKKHPGESGAPFGRAHINERIGTTFSVVSSFSQANFSPALS